MITKDKLIQTIKDLPDEFSFDDILDRILLLKKIEIGLEQSENGKTYTTEQAKEKLKKWLE
ncbi:MAG: hypothetical protein KAT68_18265 [Bacteroidales bacterium]|nr:hypothetical protein [Bacteroidales bacterium]